MSVSPCHNDNDNDFPDNNDDSPPKILPNSDPGGAPERGQLPCQKPQWSLCRVRQMIIL